MRLAAITWQPNPAGIDHDEWGMLGSQLKGRIADDDAVWDWFMKHLPKFAALVTARRRPRFIDGVQQAYGDERIED
jgi:hypothetical protein